MVAQSQHSHCVTAAVAALIGCAEAAPAEVRAMKAAIATAEILIVFIVVSLSDLSGLAALANANSRKGKAAGASQTMGGRMSGGGVRPIIGFWIDC